MSEVFEIRSQKILVKINAKNETMLVRSNTDSHLNIKIATLNIYKQNNIITIRYTVNGFNDRSEINVESPENQDNLIGDYFNYINSMTKNIDATL